MATTRAAPGLDTFDTLLKGCADPTRLRILNLLGAGELCVCDIHELLGLPQPTVSRHLAYLRRAGLVDVTREWKFAHYRMAASAHGLHARVLACLEGCFADIASLARERAQADVRAAARACSPC